MALLILYPHNKFTVIQSRVGAQANTSAMKKKNNIAAMEREADILKRKQDRATSQLRG